MKLVTVHKIMSDTADFGCITILTPVGSVAVSVHATVDADGSHAGYLTIYVPDINADTYGMHIHIVPEDIPFCADSIRCIGSVHFDTFGVEHDIVFAVFEVMPGGDWGVNSAEYKQIHKKLTNLADEFISAVAQDTTDIDVDGEGYPTNEDTEANDIPLDEDMLKRLFGL
jgi:hypothetical protein